MRKEEKPPIIYQFVNFKTGIFDILINQKIKFSNPDKFNDPFDCYEQLLEFEFTDEQSKAIILKNAPDLKNNPKQLHTLSKNYTKSNVVKEIKEKHLLDLKDTMYPRTWISCFSETYEEILMWSYYADKHKGICIGFSTKNIDKQFKVLPIDYVEDFKKMKITFDNFQEPKIVEHWLGTKYKKWDYEEEIRLLNEEMKEFYSFQKEMIKEVYFGSEVSDLDILKTVNNLKRLGYTNIHFYRMLKSKNSFSLYREEIN